MSRAYQRVKPEENGVAGRLPWVSVEIANVYQVSVNGALSVVTGA